MTLYNEYVITELTTLSSFGRIPPLNQYVCGQKPLLCRTHFTVPADADAGSVFRLFKGMPTMTRIVKAEIYNDAIAGATDVDLGVYQTDLGAVIDRDVFMDGASLATAHAIGAPLAGTTALSLVNHQERMSSYMPDPDVAPTSVDICLTIVSEPTGTGIVKIDFWILPEVD